MTRSFPALGFDPTPGEPESVQAVLLSMSRAMRTIAATLPRLEEACSITDDADWGGSAAEEFSDHGDDLPQGLGKGAEAMGKAAEALAEWGTLMKANQDKAEDLEERARTLKKQLAAAEDAVTSAASAVPHDITNPHHGARYAAYRGAVMPELVVHLACVTVMNARHDQDIAVRGSSFPLLSPTRPGVWRHGQPAGIAATPQGCHPHDHRSRG